jgi:hypothetical protein
MSELTILQTVIKKLLEGQGVESAQEIVGQAYPGMRISKYRKDRGIKKWRTNDGSNTGTSGTRMEESQGKSEVP